MVFDVVLGCFQRVKGTQPESVRICTHDTVEPFAGLIIVIDIDFCFWVIQIEIYGLIKTFASLNRCMVE